MKEFKDDLDTAVFTTRHILEGAPILYVYHFDEDGAWQFSSNENEDDIRIVSLEEIINLDNSILEIADLELGATAYRKSDKSKWIISPRVFLEN